LAQKKINCTIMRGGTSKGVFFHEKDLPPAGPERDKVILKVFGSPDTNQINGLGGAVSTTSKTAIIGPPTVPGADVNYTFGQVSILTPIVDYKGNCGNISSAVGPFAIDEGLVEAVEPETVVHIYNTNTKKIIKAYVPVEDGRAAASGDCEIAGVPGTGPRIFLEFDHPGGAVTGKLFPTGHATDEVDLGEDGKYTVSIVDAANPLVFVKAEALGLTGKELPSEIDSDPEMLRLLERIRSYAAWMLGFVDDPAKATKESPAVPKMTFVAKSDTYTTVGGRTYGAEDMDFLSRTMSMQKAHRAYAITGAICTAAAAMLPGTVVNDVAEIRREGQVTFGHPEGLITLRIKIKENEDRTMEVESASVERTARRIMEGTAYYE